MVKSTGNPFSAFLSSRLFLVLGVVLLCLLTLAFSRSYYQNYQIREEIRRLQDESEKLAGKKIEIESTLDYVKSKAYIEEKARTEMNLVKPGENVVIIQSQGSKDSSRQTESDVLKLGNISNPRKWWNYFFNHNSN